MKLKKTFVQGKMNMDIDERLLPEGQYPYAENIRVSNTDASDAGAVENVKGNYQLTNLNLTNAVVIGGYADGANQKIYWFVTSEYKDMVLEYDFRNSITNVLLESTSKTGVLKFDKKYLITGVVKLINDDYNKDLLTWTDDLNPPRIINIERAKTYGLDGFTEEDISVIKMPPKYAPKTQLTYTNTSLENNLENKFISFAYRYKFLDGEYSALSSFSNYSFAPEKFDLDYQTMENKGMVNAFNAVNITFDTGSKRVTDIEVVFKESNSNTVFLIETFNKKKEMWNDNEQRTFKFSNSKKYAALPEDELYRPYDNVPLLAKALTLGGNRLIYGNYVEGYDLVNVHGEEITIKYDVSLAVRELGGTDLTSSLLGTQTFRVDLSEVDLKESSKLTFSLNLIEPTKTKGEFSGSFDFILNKNYVSVSDLVNDDDFKVFVEDIMTSLFGQNYTSTIPANYSIDVINKFNMSSSGNIIDITSPSIRYIIDNNPSDTITLNWNFLPTSQASYSNVSVQTSLKSNRSYEAGIIYLDSNNRASTVLTDTKNTIYVPQSNAVNQNKLVVNINNEPPYWAERYKIVVKQNKGNYYNIYTNFVYRDGLYAWFKLEGTNKDKVREGDYIILKADKNRIYNNILKYQVLEVKEQPKNFIEDNVDSLGEEIEEQAGIYFKIKMEGFNISSENNKVYKATASARSENKTVPPSCYVDLFTKFENSANVDLAIPMGSRITLKFNSSFNYDAGWSSHKMEKTFLVLKDYTDFKAWYDDVIVNTMLKCEHKHRHDYKDGLEVLKGDAKMTFNKMTGVTPNPNGKLWLKVKGHETGGSGGRGGFVDAEVSIITADELYIFETEAEDLSSDIYYETEQTFDIINNKHTGNVRNQTISQSATVELNFFNCYTQGNGVESYQYKDLFNSNYINIDLRPTSTSVEKYKRVRRYADLTYSEPYNENNNINGLNEFNLYKANYKEDINKNWGSIQKLRNRNNDLLVFQEDKLSYVMYGKDLLMNADGTSNVSSIESVLGQQVPYAGEYGISKVPESHTFNGFYDYWQDPKRGCVCRLSGDGINEISQYGMRQYFKDNFKNTINNKKLGGYDPYYDEYIVFTSNIERIPPVNIDCSGSVLKDNFNGEFIINIDYGNVLGECGFTYSTKGKPIRITVEQNGTSTDYGFAGDSQYDSDLNNMELPSTNRPSSGTIMFEKIDRQPIITIRIYAPLCNSFVNLIGICPVIESGKVFFIVTNEEYYENKHFLTRYKYSDGSYVSPFKINEELFTTGLVSVFEEISGSKGVGYIPTNGSTVLMEVFYNSQEQPIFKNGGRFKYLKSNVLLGQSDINLILSNSINVSKTEIVNINGDVTYQGEFNIGNYEYLYLIYDYQSPPIAADDTVNVQIGQSVNYDIRINDVEPNGLPLSVILKSNPVYGTVVINGNGTITYTHNGMYQVNDSFTYAVTNGNAESNVATVFLNIIDNPPIANDDSAFLQNSSNVTIDVKQNDMDSYNRPLSVHIVTNPTYGTVVVNNDGTITYTHDGSTSTTDLFTYKINNGVLDSNIATVNITIGEIFTFDADYAVITYEFTDGRDLDIRTRIVTPDISMNSYLGYAKGACFPSDSSWSETNIPMNAVIDWSGDNRGIGFESILIDINKLKQQIPLITDLAVDLRCGWWNTLGNSPVNVKAIFYKGGQMIKGAQPYQYSNPTAESSLEVTSASKQISMLFEGNGMLIGDRLGVFKYDTHTHIGYFDMNDVITPTV